MRKASRRLKRSLDALDDLHRVVNDFSTQSRLSASLTNELAVVIEELFVNAVRHSAGPRDDIELHLTLQNEILTVQLIDMGVDQHDITQLAPANLDVPIEQRRAGGMGLHIVRHFADRFYYAYKNGNGIITIERNLKAPDVADTH